MRHRVIALGLLAYCVTFAITVAATPQAAPAGAAPGELPNAPGKDVTEMVCGSCHAITYLTELPRSADDWDMVLDLMQQYGAMSSKEDWDTVHKYLFTSLATVQVNKDTAKTLAAVMAADEKVGQAIVDYRTKSGNFKTIDDVKKVPGIDGAKIDALKTRLVF